MGTWSPQPHAWQMVPEKLPRLLIKRSLEHAHHAAPPRGQAARPSTAMRVGVLGGMRPWQGHGVMEAAPLPSGLQLGAWRCPPGTGAPRVLQRAQERLVIRAERRSSWKHRRGSSRVPVNGEEAGQASPQGCRGQAAASTHHHTGRLGGPGLSTPRPAHRRLWHRLLWGSPGKRHAKLQREAWSEYEASHHLEVGPPCAPQSPLPEV